MLARLDGWEELERLRKNQRTPVLMLTARDAPRDRVRGLDTGADDYLVKPFDRDELLARVRALIRRSAGQGKPEIDLGGVVIDQRTRAVMREGQPIALTAREDAILEYLALQRGKLIPAPISTFGVWRLALSSALRRWRSGVLPRKARRLRRAQRQTPNAK